jgi:glycosyltransferase involved in cell wall biosynthesis
VVIGEGSDRAWLGAALQRPCLPGVLRGRDLARAYAEMDVFVFPSTTDTFGNVVLEAMASGVPCVVGNQGGPKYLVDHGKTGFVASGLEGFAAAILELNRHPGRRSSMRHAARRSAQQYSWDAVFEDVYRRYDACFTEARGASPAATCPDLASSAST